jgi:hypothetical protein
MAQLAWTTGGGLKRGTPGKARVRSSGFGRSGGRSAVAPGGQFRDAPAEPFQVVALHQEEGNLVAAAPGDERRGERGEEHGQGAADHGQGLVHLDGDGGRRLQPPPDDGAGDRVNHLVASGVGELGRKHRTPGKRQL